MRRGSWERSRQLVRADTAQCIVALFNSTELHDITTLAICPPLYEHRPIPPAFEKVHEKLDPKPQPSELPDFFIAASKRFMPGLKQMDCPSPAAKTRSSSRESHVLHSLKRAVAA